MFETREGGGGGVPLHEKVGDAGRLDYKSIEDSCTNKGIEFFPCDLPSTPTFDIDDETSPF